MAQPLRLSFKLSTVSTGIIPYYAAISHKRLHKTTIRENDSAFSPRQCVLLRLRFKMTKKKLTPTPLCLNVSIR